MQYKNKITGVIIEVSGQISGKNWEPVEAPKRGKKKSAKAAKDEEAAYEDKEKEEE